jgi:hypothetical protein
MSRATGAKAIPPRGIAKPSTRQKKAKRRAARGNGGRRMPERWRFKRETVE